MFEAALDDSLLQADPERLEDLARGMAPDLATVSFVTPAPGSP